MPTNRRIDLKLVVGAAIFGLGWGLGALCPGPGIMDFFTLTHVIFWVMGFTVGQLVFWRPEAPKQPPFGYTQTAGDVTKVVDAESNIKPDSPPGELTGSDKDKKQ